MAAAKKVVFLQPLSVGVHGSVNQTQVINNKIVTAMKKPGKKFSQETLLMYEV